MTNLTPHSPLDQPALPGLELTPLGVRTTGDQVDVAATVAHLIKLRRLGATWRWIVGDLILAVAAEHDGDLAHAFQLIASEDLDDPASLSRSIYVARGVPMERRTTALTWSHHAEVADLDAEDQTRWLAEAAEDGLTVSALRTLIAEEYAGAGPDPDDEPTLLPTVAKSVVAQIEACWAQRPDALVVLTLDPDTQKARVARTLGPDGGEL